MTQSKGGGEEDALDRLLRRNVFEPVTPEDDEDVAANPPDLVDRPIEPGPESSPTTEGPPPRFDRQSRDTEPGPGAVRVRQVSSRSPDDALPDWEQVRQSLYFRLFIIAIAIVVAFVLLRVLVAGVGGGLSSLIDRLVALDDPFRPVPNPDDPVVLARPNVRAAARVAAPLVLAVIWLMGGYQIDRAARRALRVGGLPGVRIPLGYGAAAIGCVFPLLVFGMAGVAWGGINLGVWTVRNQAWAPAGLLLALLAAFAILIRALVAWQDRRDRQEHFR